MTTKDSPESDSEYVLAEEEFLKEDDPIDKVISSSLGNPVEEDSDAESESSSSNENQPLEGGITKTEKSVDEPEPYSESELETIRDKVFALKAEGNAFYRDKDFYKAMGIYTDGIELCRNQFDEERSILYSNRAACHLTKEEYVEAEEDCTAAIALNENYLKAILRRAHAREKLDKLSPALEDYQKVVELDPRNATAIPAVLRLPDQIKEQQEKMKEECISKLKDLGNLVLKPFGLSTDNFKMIQDPNTGGYNIQFSQEK